MDLGSRMGSDPDGSSGTARCRWGLAASGIASLYQMLGVSVFVDKRMGSRETQSILLPCVSPFPLPLSVLHHRFNDSRAQSLAPLSPSLADLPEPTITCPRLSFAPGDSLRKFLQTRVSELPATLHSSDDRESTWRGFACSFSFFIEAETFRYHLGFHTLETSIKQLQHPPRPPSSARPSSYPITWLPSLLHSPLPLSFLLPVTLRVGREQYLLLATTQKDLAGAAHLAQSST